MKMNVAHLPELKKFHHITVTKFLRKVFQVEKHGLQSFQFLSLPISGIFDNITFDLMANFQKMRWYLQFKCGREKITVI